MNAQAVLSGFRSSSPSACIYSPAGQFYPTLPHCFSNSFVRSQNWVHFHAHQHFSSLSARFKKRFECRNSVEKAGDLVEGGAAEESGVVRKRLAVFVSGGGSNFQSIHRACARGSVCGDIVVLVTNKHGCGGAMYARDNGIPVILFPATKDESGELSPADLVTALRRFKVDFILLAGYLKLIPRELIESYPRSILNIHPSLLPAFGGKGYYGMKVHRAVIASGARYSGPTVHFVDDCYDTGRILAQRIVPVLANDTADDLSSRVLHVEHELYVEAATALCEDRIIWREDGVPLIRSKQNLLAYC